ncbi:hypothetical protein IHE49_15180 [Rhodanobacter sp. 7MK24]|uniref:hypothetical protein n=1 Tax=Rhodanobacter sp. 7MK24 TaxID=2775922 RepID=UPI00177BAFB1|nr:hypothetical protein [Rhodanobacter sp. 7MK24]MBD8881829.1 hypothetical protein [Rhodanobacter sp. 7MK24]
MRSSTDMYENMPSCWTSVPRVQPRPDDYGGYDGRRFGIFLNSLLRQAAARGHPRRAMMTCALNHGIEVMEYEAQKTGFDIDQLHTTVRERLASIARPWNGRRDYSMHGGFAIRNILACMLRMRSRIKSRRQVCFT